MRNTRLALALFSQFLKTRLANRVDFFTEFFSTAISSLFAFSFVLLLFVPIDSLAGWRRDEVVFIYGLSLIPYGLFATVSWNLYDFGSKYIVDGGFDRVLLRPMNSFLQVLCESFRIQALAESAIGVLVAWNAAARLDLSLGIEEVLWIVIAICSGTVIFIAVFGVLAAASFFAEDRIGIAPPVFNLINPARYPPDIFGPSIRFLLRYVVPFHFVAFFPATLVLGRLDSSAPWLWTPVAAALCCVVLWVVWSFGLRRYSSTGS
jgi:ABC-2 type transport system permease protein